MNLARDSGNPDDLKFLYKQMMKVRNAVCLKGTIKEQKCANYVPVRKKIDKHEMQMCIAAK